MIFCDKIFLAHPYNRPFSGEMPIEHASVSIIYSADFVSGCESRGCETMRLSLSPAYGFLHVN